MDSLPSCNMGCGDISVDNAEVQPPESEEGGWLYITVTLLLYCLLNYYYHIAPDYLYDTYASNFSATKASRLVEMHGLGVAEEMWTTYQGGYTLYSIHSTLCTG